jgi:hypothetical protein
VRRDIHTCSALLAVAIAIASAPRSATCDGFELHSSADVGMGSLDEDGFVLVLLEQGLSYGGFHLVLSGPLRFRVIDAAPEDDGALREQDWDEPSDFARIARRVAFEKELDDGIVDVYLGELNDVGIGHGAAVDHYFNSVDMDHYQGGARLDVGYAGNGIEFIMDDVVAPELLVGRARIAPFAWFLDGDWPRRLELGFALGSDIAAPRRVMAATDTAIVFGGGDVSLRVLDFEAFSLTPYVDIMGMDGDAGVHAGLAAAITFSKKNEIVLSARGEYRRLGSDYHPALLNPFYEHSRRFYSRDPAEGGVNTFADHLANPETADPESNGWMADALFSVGKAFSIEARFDSEGVDRPHWLLVELALAPNDRFDLRTMYAGRDPDGAASVFSADALVGLGTRVHIWKPFSAFAEFSRRFRRVGDEMPYANESAFGVGIFFEY